MTSWPISPALSLLAYQSWKKSCTWLLHFCTLPFDIAHTFRATGHSHSKCEVDSGCWQQMSHLGSTFTLRLCRFSLVGRMFEHALQLKFLTFGGTFKAQIVFHTLPSIRAFECSAPSWCDHGTHLSLRTSLPCFPSTLTRPFCVKHSRVWPKSHIGYWVQKIYAPSVCSTGPCHHQWAHWLAYLSVLPQ